MIPRWTHILIHHSLTPDGDTVDLQAFRRYHVDALGWSDIGYHYVIERVNGQFEAIVGRPIYKTGAHCSAYQMNSKAIGLCVAGNFDKEDVPPGAMLKLSEVVKANMMLFNIPIDNIEPHSKYNPVKTCPGLRFDMDLLKRLL